MPRHASGALFYAVAGLFALGTATVTALWVLQAVEVRDLEDRLDRQVDQKDYPAAVETAARLKVAAFRWSRPKWGVRQADLLLQWSEQLCKDNKHTQALKLATQAEDVGTKAGLGKDEAFTRRVNVVLAAASLGVLRGEWASLPPDKRVSRLETIRSKYPDTPAAAEAGGLLNTTTREQEAYRKAWADLCARTEALASDGRTAEALAELEAFAPTCQAHGPFGEEYKEQLARKVADLKRQLDEGYFLVRGPQAELPPGAPLEAASCRVLWPGKDFTPLTVPPGRIAAVGSFGKQGKIRHPDRPGESPAGESGVFGPVGRALLANTAKTGTTQPADPPPAPGASKRDFFLIRFQGMLLCYLTGGTGQSRRAGTAGGAGWPFWALDQGMGMAFAPQRFGDDVVCVHDRGRKITRLHGPSGKVVWSLALASAPACQFAAVSGALAVLDQQGTLRILAAADGRPLAQYKLTDTQPARLVSTGASGWALAVVAGDRALLFETFSNAPWPGESRGPGQAQERGNRWYRTGVILLGGDAGEEVSLLDQYVLVSAARAGAGASAKRRDRLFLWRDRDLTPATAPDFPGGGGQWHLADQHGDYQVWLGTDEEAMVTWLDKSRLGAPFQTLKTISARGMTRAMLSTQAGRLLATLSGEGVWRMAVPSPAATRPAPAGPDGTDLDWRRSVPAPDAADEWGPPGAFSPKNIAAGVPSAGAAHDLLVDRVVRAAEGRLIVAGIAGGATVVAEVSKDEPAALLVQLGPSPAGRAVQTDSGAVWSDGWSGLWFLAANGDGGVRHQPCPVTAGDEGGGPGGAGLRVAGGGGGGRFLAYTDDRMLLYDGGLRPLWPKPVRFPPGPGGTGGQADGPPKGPLALGVVSACLHGGAIVLLDAKGGLHAASTEGPVGMESGKAAPLPAGLPAQLPGRLAGEPEILSTPAGLLASMDAGWVLLTPAPVPLAEGLTRLVGYDPAGTVLLLGSDQGALACWDVANRRLRWRQDPKAPEPGAVWAAPVGSGSLAVLTEAGQLQTRNAATGALESVRDLSGVPTASGAAHGQQLWLPLSGCRLVGLSLAEPKATPSPVSGGSSKPENPQSEIRNPQSIAGPVGCTFDVSGVAQPATAEAAIRRLRSALARDLCGGAGSPAGLHLKARFRRGRLLGEAWLSIGKAPPTLLAARTLSTVDELADLANAQLRSRSIWLARLESPAADGRTWKARPLLARAAPAEMLCAPDGSSIWKVTVPAGIDGLCTLQKLRGAAEAGDILIPLRTRESGIVLTVVNSDQVPLADMQIYARAGAFPDEHPLRMRAQTPLDVTDRDGRARFAWKSKEPAYLLIARNYVPLVRFVVAPTSETHADRVVISRLWYLEAENKTVSLDRYVIVMRQKIDKAVDEHNRRMAALDKATKLITEGKLDEAKAAIAQLPADDPVRQEVEGLIRLAEAKGEVEKLLYRAHLAEAVKDYDAAVKLLTEAIGKAPEARKAGLQDRLTKLQADAQALRQKVGPAAKQLADLGRQTARQIVDSADQIAQAVDVLCQAAQVSSLVVADKQLGEALGVLNAQILADVEKIKAGTMDKDDPLFLKLGKASTGLIRCRERISAAIQRVRLPG